MFGCISLDIHNMFDTDCFFFTTFSPAVYIKYTHTMSSTQYMYIVCVHLMYKMCTTNLKCGA